MKKIILNFEPQDFTGVYFIPGKCAIAKACIRQLGWEKPNVSPDDAGDMANYGVYYSFGNILFNGDLIGEKEFSGGHYMSIKTAILDNKFLSASIELIFEPSGN